MLSTRLISALVEMQIRIWSTRFVLPLLRYKQVVQLTQPTARPTDGATSNSNAPGGQHELKSTRQCLGTSRALCGNAGSAAVRVGPTATAGGGSSTNFSASAGLTDDRELNSNAVTALCFAPTRRSLVCGDDTGKVTVWDLQVRPLPTHSSHLATHDVFVRLTLHISVFLPAAPRPSPGPAIRQQHRFGPQGSGAPGSGERSRERSGERSRERSGEWYGRVHDWSESGCR